jgi:DNA-binding MarR family transcriptional regulator
MTTDATIRLFMLEALDRLGDEPMPEGALVGSVLLAHRHLNVTRTDARSVVLELEALGMVSATRDALTEQTLYALTPKGRSVFRARQ